MLYNGTKYDNIINSSVKRPKQQWHKQNTVDLSSEEYSLKTAQSFTLCWILSQASWRLRWEQNFTVRCTDFVPCSPVHEVARKTVRLQQVLVCSPFHLSRGTSPLNRSKLCRAYLFHALVAKCIHLHSKSETHTLQEIWKKPMTMLFKNWHVSFGPMCIFFLKSIGNLLRKGLACLARASISKQRCSILMAVISLLSANILKWHCCFPVFAAPCGGGKLHKIHGRGDPDQKCGGDLQESENRAGAGSADNNISFCSWKYTQVVSLFTKKVLQLSFVTKNLLWFKNCIVIQNCRILFCIRSHEVANL